MIGSSLGGLKALQTLLPALISSCSLPVVIIQHRDADIHTGDMLRNILQRSTRSILYEADHGLPIETGKVYLAPADYHLTIDEDRISLSKDLPVAHARPSINLAFESASRSYGTEAIGVILTGTGSDGAAGLAEIERRGGVVIVQEPSDAEHSSMPRAAIAATQHPEILSLEKLGKFLCWLEQSDASKHTTDGGHDRKLAR
jgi:two-component system chemotaxis response regulator CheB